MGILVVGASGLLGSNVVAAARERGLGVAGTYRTEEPDLPADLYELELPDVDRFRAIVDAVDPSAVVNCAALTDVDGCETAPDRASAVNATAAGDVARTCAGRDVRLVHVSTDYVFDGASGTPYAEDDDPAPLQRYGETKLAGEEAVRAAADRHYVLRPSFVWGVHRGSGELTGFPAWVERSLRDGDAVSLYTDQHVTPSRALTTAETALDLLEAAPPETYHVACRSCVTPFEFGDEIRRQLDAPEELLDRGTADGEDREATRPSNTCLDVGRVESALGRRQPTLRQEVAEVFERRTALGRT